MTQLLALALVGALGSPATEPTPPPPVADPAPAGDESPVDATQEAATADAEGRRHFEAGNFAEAAALYARAHAQDPRPAYLYRWAQAERRAGNCPAAAQLYRRYLEHDVGPENEVAARKNLARCGYADEPVDTAEPAAAASPPPQDRTPAPALPHPRAWLRDPWGITLAGLGGGGLLAAAILGGGSAAEIRRANDAAVEDEYVRHAARADTLRVAAITTGVIGAALLVGGVTRWLLVRRRDRRAAGAHSAGLLTLRF
jgi:tetratricopeptide (TPR) repeat protein